MPRVIMDRAYSYEIDAARQRTLPRGWRGEVEKDVANQIKKGGFGRVIGGRGGGAAKTGGGDQGASGSGGGAAKTGGGAAKTGGGDQSASGSGGGGGE